MNKYCTPLTLRGPQVPTGSYGDKYFTAGVLTRRPCELTETYGTVGMCRGNHTQIKLWRINNRSTVDKIKLPIMKRYSVLWSSTLSSVKTENHKHFITLSLFSATKSVNFVCITQVDHSTPYRVTLGLYFQIPHFRSPRISTLKVLHKKEEDTKEMDQRKKSETLKRHSRT